MRFPDTRRPAIEQMMVPSHAGELMMAAILLLVGLLFIAQSALLPLGDLGLPGPGFAPLALGIALALIALLLGSRAVYHRGADEEAVNLGHRASFLVFAALLGVGFAFERLGVYVTLGLFTGVVLVLVARISMWRGALSASLGMIAVWGLFEVLLGIQLPDGPF